MVPFPCLSLLGLASLAIVNFCIVLPMLKWASYIYYSSLAKPLLQFYDWIWTREGVGELFMILRALQINVLWW